MRRYLLFLLFVSVSLSARAEDLLGPAEYIKILSDSKLVYTIQDKPSKSPVEELRCERRDERTRLVMKDGRKKLVAWLVKPEALTLLNEGQALYEERKFAEAMEKWKAALAIDPEAVAGYYFYGDALLFGAKDPAAALEQYRKGLALDPTMPTGHLFAATALGQLGKHDEAREEIIKALTYHPAFDSVWKIAENNPERWNNKPVVRHKFEPPPGYLGKSGKDVDIYSGKDSAWLGYAICKAVWANEEQFIKRTGTAGGWSLEVERACVHNQVMGSFNTAQSSLEEGKRPVGQEQIIAAMPRLERHIYEVAMAGHLDGYILFEIIGQHCPLGMSTLDDDALRLIENYIRKYVIVAGQ